MARKRKGGGNSTKTVSDYSVYVADFETLTKDSEDYLKTGLTGVSYAYIENFKTDKAVLFKGENSLEEFIDYVITEQNDDGSGTSKTIYFHNLSWDGQFIVKKLVKMGYADRDAIDLEGDDEKLRKNKYAKKFEIFRVDNQILRIVIKKSFYAGKNKNGNSVYKYSTINFQCSYKLLNSSVDALGKALGRQKVGDDIKHLVKKHYPNEPYYPATFYNMLNYSNPEEIDRVAVDYIKSDVGIVKETLKILKETLDASTYRRSLKYPDKPPKSLWNELTIGSITWNMARKYVIRNKPQEIANGMEVSYNMYNEMDNYYYGGWVQLNPYKLNKRVEEDCIKIDINSSYPHQMTKLLPYGEFLDEKPKGHYLEFLEIDVEYARLKPKYKNMPTLINWEKRELIRTTEKFRYMPYEDEYGVTEMTNFKCFYLREEWEIIKKMHHIKYKVNRTRYTKAAYYMKDFIEEIYQYKVDNKKAGKTAIEGLWKVGINSIYGKTTQRALFPIKRHFPLEQLEELEVMRENGELYVTEDWRTKKELEYEIGTIHRNTVGMKYGIVELIPTVQPKSCRNKIIGAVITANARIQLWNLILAVGVDKFRYSDTDSILLKCTLEHLLKHAKIDDYELGAWGLENYVKSYHIVGPKKIGYEVYEQDKKGNFTGKVLEKITYAGVSKRAREEPKNKEALFEEGAIITEGKFPVIHDENGVYLGSMEFTVGVGTT